VLIGGANLTDGMPARVYGVWFLVLYAWVGMWHPPRVCLAISPVVTVAYVIPLLLQDHLPGDIASVGIAIPAGVMLGEVLAKTVEALRRSQRDHEEAAALLAKASVTDDLTGVGNRRHGNQLLDGLAPGDAVVLLDLDHFKSVNDEFGHARPSPRSIGWWRRGASAVPR
jgi:predicted signal transduction protein with EAL and GGDEF domain